MQHQLVNLQGGTVTSDSQATPDAVVERDDNGDTFQNGTNAAAYLKTMGETYARSRSYAANQTLDHLANATTIVKLDATGGAFTLTLPPAAGSQYQLLVAIKTDSSGNVPTIHGNAAETINGANTFTGLSAQYKTVGIWCDGTQWFILFKN